MGQQAFTTIIYTSLPFLVVKFLNWVNFHFKSKLLPCHTAPEISNLVYTDSFGTIKGGYKFGGLLILRVDFGIPKFVPFRFGISLRFSQ